MDWIERTTTTFSPLGTLLQLLLALALSFTFQETNALALQRKCDNERNCLKLIERLQVCDGLRCP